MRVRMRESSRAATVVWVAIAVVVVVLGCCGFPARVGAAQLYTGSSAVTDLHSISQLNDLKRAKKLTIIEIYRVGCGFCQQFAPEYEKVAQKLKRLVNVMAVDVERNMEVARELESRYNFKLQGVPHIFFLKPQASGKQKRILFDSDRKANVLYKAALAQMPDYSRYVTDASLHKLLREDDLPFAVLVTSKPTTPPIWKALSAKYEGRMKLGVTNPKQKAVVEAAGVADTPGIGVLRSNTVQIDPQFGEPVVYSGPVSFMGIDFFLLDHALPGKSGSSSRSSSNNNTRSGNSKSKRGHTSTGSDSSNTGRGEAKSTNTRGSKGKKNSGPRGASGTNKKTAGDAAPSGKTMDMDIPDNLSALRVAELRKLLKQFKDPCNGCVEKQHMVERLEVHRKKQQQRVQQKQKADEARRKTQHGRCSEEVRALREENAVLRQRLQTALNSMAVDGCPQPRPTTTILQETRDFVVEEISDSAAAHETNEEEPAHGDGAGGGSDDSGNARDPGDL